jgi:hypothetical protein
VWEWLLLGEDAIVLRNLRVKVQDVRVYAPVRLLQEI